MAEMALAHHSGILIPPDRIVRASHLAVPAADAPVGMMENHAILPSLFQGSGGASLRAGRVGAVVARDGEVERVSASRCGGKLVYFAPQQAGRRPVGVGACGHASKTAEASLRIENENPLLHPSPFLSSTNTFW